MKLKSTEARSRVVGSGLVAAAVNVPRQTREDLVNCRLFAQLAATGEVGNAAKVIGWYDAYFRTGRNKDPMHFQFCTGPYGLGVVAVSDSARLGQSGLRRPPVARPLQLWEARRG